jgi:CheY-like chemotaxis protein
MTFLIVLVTAVIFIIVDLTMRVVMKRIDRARQRRERREALDLGLKIEIADEAKSLKRVEVKSPKARILAVDDEAIVLDSFRKILVLDGYSVDTVATGQEALGLVQKGNYDFVFTDLKMPEMDGLDVTKAVKHFRPDVDVIMITGYASVQSAVEAMKYGALDYVEKPFTEDELTAFVNKSLIRRQDRIERDQPPKVHLVTAASIENSTEHAYNVPAGLFVSPAHVWIKIEMTGEVRAGLDDFARKAIGEVDSINVPKVGRRVTRGQPLFTVNQEARSLAFPSPLTAEITAVNEELIHHPEYVKVNPYEVGWICRLEPVDLAGELESLRIGRAAVSWYEEEIERFGNLLQELDRPKEGAATGTDNGRTHAATEQMPDEAWDAFSRSFLRM